jgi:hypothetical protein
MSPEIIGDCLRFVLAATDIGCECDQRERETTTNGHRIASGVKVEKKNAKKKKIARDRTCNFKTRSYDT